MIWHYIRLGFRYFFKDPILMVPYAAYYAVLNIVMTMYLSHLDIDKLLKMHSAKFIGGMIFLALVEAFILGVTLSALRYVIESSKASKKQFLASSFFVGLHTFFGTAALIPLAVILVVALKPLFAMALPFRLVAMGIGFFVGGFLLMLKFFFPAAIVVDHVGWVSSFKNTLTLFRKHFALTLTMSLGMFSFWMMMLIVSELVSAIPVVGLGILNVVIQAVSSVIGAAVSVFYYSVMTESPLKTMWSSQESEEDEKSSL